MMSCSLEDGVPDMPLEIYDPIKDEVVKKHFSEFEGKWVVLVFYPADFTFVCPTELRDLNNKYDQICQYNTEVFVASTDTVFSHKRRVETEKLLEGFKIPMIADRTQDLSLLFAALNQDTGNAERATIVLSPQGMLWSLIVPNSVRRV
jgi:peroxiredoxin (alkyl hydroperoxide reductase subunit C)